MNPAMVDCVIFMIGIILLILNFHGLESFFHLIGIYALQNGTANLLRIFFYNYKINKISPAFLVEL